MVDGLPVLRVGRSAPVWLARVLAIALMVGGLLLSWLLGRILTERSSTSEDPRVDPIQSRPALVLVPGLVKRTPDARVNLQDRDGVHSRIDALYVCVTEVTVGQWRTLMEKHLACSFHGCVDNLPASRVSNMAACTFLNRLTDQENETRTRSNKEPLTRCYAEESCDRVDVGCTGFRLPTTSEWEYFAHSGGLERPEDLNIPERFCERANRADASYAGGHVGGSPELRISNRCDDGFPLLAPVGSFAANPWGIYDAYGNVAEWVLDPCDNDEWRECYATKAVGGSATDSPWWYGDSSSEGVRGIRCVRSPTSSEMARDRKSVV